MVPVLKRRLRASAIRLPVAVLLAAAQPAGTAADLHQRVRSGGHSVTPRPAPKQLKLVSWNIERGLQYPGIEAALVRESADILLLQEVDWKARRSGWREIPESLARKLGMNYVFAAEFQELGQGTSSSPAYHGQAILSAWPIGPPAVIQFKQQSDFWAPRWYLPNWGLFQRRIGGRLALAAEIDVQGRGVAVYNVHLESRGPESLRVAQMREVLDHASRHSGDAQVVIAGDFNVSGPSSPVIRAILDSGFSAAVGGEATTLRGAALDWIFVRGDLRFTEGGVLRETRASDHYPLKVTLSGLRGP